MSTSTNIILVMNWIDYYVHAPDLSAVADVAEGGANFWRLMGRPNGGLVRGPGRCHCSYARRGARNVGLGSLI